MKRSWNNTGKIIKEYRVKHGISQLELTRAVVGKSDNGQFFWNIEAGKAGLPPKHICKISQVLMVPLVALKEAMIKDYEENLNASIKEELDKV